MSILENSIIVFHQILIMFLLMVVGYILFKTGIFDNHTTTVHPAQHHRHSLLCAGLLQPGF